MSDLMENLRNKGYGNIEEIMYCVLETNGTISVLPKASARAATTSEAGIVGKDPSLRYTVVYEGKADEENLQLMGASAQQLNENLKALGFGGIEDIYAAMMDGHDHLFIQQAKTGKTCFAQFKRRSQ